MTVPEPVIWLSAALIVLSWVWASITVTLAQRRHDRHTANLLDENRRLTELVAAVKTPWAAEVVRSLQAGQEREDGVRPAPEPEPEVLA